MKSPEFAALGSVAVGSANPVKVRATRAVLERVAPQARVQGVDVPSGVRDQPWGDEETILGATNRARAALVALDTDLAVGIEGGVVESADGTLRTCAWAVAVSKSGRVGVGGSLAMPLPPSVSESIRRGTELGHAMDALTASRDTKTGAGAVGILTRGLVDRQQAYEVLVTYALAPFLTPEHWDPVPGAVNGSQIAPKRPFTLHEYVRWGDVDPAGIIRYDAYLRFYELGESELFRSLGIPYGDLFSRFEVGLPRRVLHLDFASPPRLDEHLEVRVYISEVGTTSMTMNFDVYGAGGIERSFGHMVLVCVEPAVVEKRPWPPGLLEILEPYRMSVAHARGT